MHPINEKRQPKEAIVAKSSETPAKPTSSETQSPTAPSSEKPSSTAQTDVKPLEGTITVDGDLPFESQILAYKTLNRIAAQIARDVNKTITENVFDPMVIIHSDVDINSVLVLQEFAGQLALNRKQLTDLEGGEKPGK